MSLDLKSVHVRLTAEAHTALRMVSEVHGSDLGESARLILTEALLGKVYAIRKAVEGAPGKTKP